MAACGSVAAYIRSVMNNIVSSTVIIKFFKNVMNCIKSLSYLTKTNRWKDKYEPHE